VERSLKVGKITKEVALDNLTVFNLRRYTVEERIKIIEYGVQNEQGVGVVIIDGIRDLMYDINNPEQSSDLVSYLLQWSHDRNVHIIAVLHQNKTDSNIRGHIGTEVLNKCETHVEVITPNPSRNVSIVHFNETRNLPPEPFAFSINEKGLPIPVDMPRKEKSEKYQIQPDRISEEYYKKALDIVFKDSIELNQSQLKQELKKHLEIGDNKIRKCIEYCVDDLGLLEVSKGKNNAKLYRRL